jgi:transposase
MKKKITLDRKAYPSDVSDEEWAPLAPYLTLMTGAPQRGHSLHEVFNVLRYIARTGAQWRWRSHDLLAWRVVYQQSQRWIKATPIFALKLVVSI